MAAIISSVPIQRTATLRPASSSGLTIIRSGSGSKYSHDSFKPGRMIGIGGYGRVQLVLSRANKQYFALKILSKHATLLGQMDEQANNERAILAMIDSPFITKLYGTFQDQMNVYFVMEFIPGGDMRSLLNEAGMFYEETARFYAAEVTLALAHLHERGIVYRDLKCENILLDRRGHAKLCDFGFARELEPTTGLAAAASVGTPDYMAPELVRRAREGHGRPVDCWSLGVLLFELLAGHCPFEAVGPPQPSGAAAGNEPEEIFARVAAGRFDVPAWFGAAAADLVARLLSRDPRRRPDIGAVRGHAWFRDTDWRLMERRALRAPFDPCAEGGLGAGEGDLSRFELPATEDVEEMEAMGRKAADKLDMSDEQVADCFVDF